VEGDTGKTNEEIKNLRGKRGSKKRKKTVTRWGGDKSAIPTKLEKSKRLLPARGALKRPKGKNGMGRGEEKV